MPQLSFRTRRVVSLLATIVILTLFAVLARSKWDWLGESAIFTGFTLLGTVLLLALLGVRRRLPILRLGSMSTWTQIHLYMGLFSCGAYLIHVPVIVGSGLFNGALSIVFLMVAISGCYGVFASRTLPKRLAASAEQPRFDRVAWHRDQIASAASAFLSEIDGPTGATRANITNTGAVVLSDFYSEKLNPFFSSGPSMAYVMLPRGARRRRLLRGLSELDRYLEGEGRRVAGRLANLVRRRDELDYQFALQLRMRLWLVMHCMLSLALVGGGIVHGVLAWRLHG